MKKCIAVWIVMVLLLTGCTSAPPETVPTTTAAPTTVAATTETTAPVIKPRNETNIFISLPKEDDPHWSQAGQDLKMLLENLSYIVTLSYAGGEVAEQVSQLTAAIENGADCLIVAALDSAALIQVGQLAMEENVILIAYDRLIMDTESVGYYVSYDYTAMGVALGQHIVEQKGLDALAEGQSLTIEFFMGPPEDSSALALYRGVMQVLQPYLESGVLVSKTGRVDFEDTCIVDWDPGLVTGAMKNYLSEFYRRGAAPDIICTVSDRFADACIGVLTDKKVKTMPLITGLGGTETGFAHILAGNQSMTVQTDLYLLNEKCMELVDAVLMGNTAPVNDTENCHNNALVVPAYLCDFELITAENVPQPEPETTAATASTE